MANYLNFTKALFNPYNPKVLNEGQFSWMTQDTDEQIGSERENTIEVWMYDNEGNSWYEKRYEGYGEFGGMDYYELLARMNGYSEEDLEDKKVLKAMSYGKEMRDIGISLAFEKLPTKDKGKKVLFPALVADGRYNWKRHDFTQEAESDPNQSWYQEPEYDDYEDDYYESNMTEAQKLNEWGSSDQNIMNQSIHKDAGKPKKMPSPFDAKLRAAAEDAVDFYWDDWEEYQTDREALVDDAVRGYLRSYFKKDFEMMVRMFEPMESAKVDDTSAVIEGLTWDGLKESLGLNEGRSINKISKDHAQTVLDMSKTVGEWKEAEGDRKTELLELLRELNKRKADLEKELDDAVAGKDRNLQLSLDEAEDLAYLEIDVKNILG